MNPDNIHLAQIDVTAGRPDKNLWKIQDLLKKTPEDTLTIFPEMAVSGYMIGDDWLREDFVRECEAMNREILDILKERWQAAIWWNIETDTNKKNTDGSIRKYNSAYIAQNGKLLDVRQKTLLPNYRMFDDERYFTSLIDKAAEEEKNIWEYYAPVEIEIEGVKYKVSTLICEDIWNINRDYPLNPVALTKEYSPDLMAVVSASPFGTEKRKFRDKLLRLQSQDTSLAYVNPIGSQNIWKTIHVFDGGSSLYQNWKYIRWIRDYSENSVSETLEEKEEMQEIFEALVYGLKKFWENTGKKKFVIGLSGGLDSALVAYLLVEAIGAENIIAVNMPSKFNSDTTKDLAEQTAENLGIKYLVSPIQSIVDEEIALIEQTTGKEVSSFDKENIQARTRGIRLAGIAANQNALFTNNGNKDEVAIGYATLYGDVAGAIAPIWDLYKDLQVRPLARYINQRSGKEIIPEKIIEMQPTAELSDMQNPESGGGDPFNYEFLWKINWATIEKKMTPESILRAYANKTLKETLWLSKEIEEYFPDAKSFIEELEKIWNLQKRAVFKRIQAPAIIQVSRGSFGFDYREAMNEPYFGEAYYKLKEQILDT